MKESIIYQLMQNELFQSGKKLPDNLSETEWEEIFDELKAQTVAGIPADSMLSLGILPDVVRQKWEKLRMQQVGFYCHIMHEENEIVELMKSAGIPMAVIKGAAAAVNYPDASARSMGDIDFLVLAEDVQRAHELMLNNGYADQDAEREHTYHIGLSKNNVDFELHWRLPILPKGEKGRYLLELLREGIQSCRYIQLDGYEIPILPEPQNGIALLMHIIQHLRIGLGLRQIIDWMMYVDKHLHDSEWYAVMQPALQKLGYEQFAKHVTRMCQIYLGLEENGITWCMDADPDLCDGILTHVMQQGNFGRKVGAVDTVSRRFSRIHNPVQLFKLLQKEGEQRWKATKKYPVLRRFAWLYMSFIWIYKGFARKSPIKTLLSDVQQGSKRKNLFDELDIYTDE